MIRNISFFVMLVLPLVACRGKGAAEVDSLDMVARAIDFCIVEYTRLSEKRFFNEVDKAYVHVSSGRLGIVFARGETGTFGDRSENYQAYLSCGIELSDELRIHFLSSPMKDPLIELKESQSIDGDFYKGDVKELLYIRDGDRFTLVDAQDLTESNLESFTPHGETGPK